MEIKFIARKDRKSEEQSSDDAADGDEAQASDKEENKD